MSFISDNFFNKTLNSTKFENKNENGSKRIIKQGHQNEIKRFAKEINQSVNQYRGKSLSKINKNFMFKQSLDDLLLRDKINEIKHEIKTLILRDKFSSTVQEFPELIEYDSYQKGVSNRTIYTKLKRHMNNMLKLNKIFDSKINQRKVRSLGRLLRFKSLNLKAEIQSQTSNFAKLSFILLKKELSAPTQQELIDKMLSNPDTRNLIETALKNKKNKVIYTNEQNGRYQVINRKTSIKTVDLHSIYHIIFRKN